MKIYIFDREKDQIAKNEDGINLVFNSPSDATEYFLSEGLKIEFIKENFLFLRSVKHLTSEEITIDEPSKEVKEKVDFNMLAHYAIQYLNEYHHPHTSIIITNSSAELVEGIKAVNTDEYIKD